MFILFWQLGGLNWELVPNKLSEEYWQGKIATELYKSTCYKFLHPHENQHMNFNPYRKTIKNPSTFICPSLHLRGQNVVAFQCAMQNKMKMANRKMKWASWDSFFSLFIQIHCRRECFPLRNYSILSILTCAIWRRIAWLYLRADISKSSTNYVFGEKKEFGEVEEQEHLLLPHWNDLRGINLGCYSYSVDKIYVSIGTASNVFFSEFRREKKERKIRFQTCLLIKVC